MDLILRMTHSNLTNITKNVCPANEVFQSVLGRKLNLNWRIMQIVIDIARFQAEFRMYNLDNLDKLPELL